MNRRKSNSRPKTIKILNLRYKIKFVKDTERTASEADGWCDPSNQTIAIYDGLPREAMADTFLHEVIHAIGNVMGIEWGSEESVARRVATGLCTVMKANPSAFRWWQSLL